MKTKRACDVLKDCVSGGEGDAFVSSFLAESVGYCFEKRFRCLSFMLPWTACKDCVLSTLTVDGSLLIRVWLFFHGEGNSIWAKCATIYPALYSLSQYK